MHLFWVLHVFNFDQTTNYAGESAHVCLNQGNTFTCPTSSASCDEEKCPLQGSPVATKIGPEPAGLIFQPPWIESDASLMPISGQVIVGGVDTAILSGIELFPRPTSDACSIPDLPDPAAGHSLSLLSGGRLVVCGVGGSGELCTMGVYSSLL